MADEQTDTPPVPAIPEAAALAAEPAIKAVLRAIQDSCHRDCGCDQWPDSCLNDLHLPEYDTHSEEARWTLEIALQQGWTAPASAVTPPVAGEIPDAAVKAAADAMRTLLVPFAHKCQPFAPGQIGSLLNPTTTEVATAALTAALPHLTAERDAETTALRAALEAVRAELATATDMVDTGGSALIGPDVEDLADVLDAAMNAVVEALADPAPSTPAAQENQT